MATTSVQDVDAFIRMQKEKLSMDKSNSNPSQNFTNSNSDYQKQLDNYLKLPRSFENTNQSYENNMIQQQSNQVQQRTNFQLQTQQIPLQFQLNMPQQQQQQQQQQNDKNSKENDDPAQFFGQFGSKYDEQKNKLKNDLHQEYNEYLQRQKLNQNSKSQKNKQQISEEFYATLPLKGMEANKKKAEYQRNLEYQILQNKLDNSEKKNVIEWWKDHNEPDIKPYSKHVSSQENLSNIKNSVFNNGEQIKSNQNRPNQLNLNDPISDRRLQLPDNRPPQQYQTTPQQQYQQFDYNNFNSSVHNSLENLRQFPMEAWRSPVPPPIFNQMPVTSMIDPSLSDILRRPPVGYKQQIMPNQFINRQNDYPIMNPDMYRYQNSQSPPLNFSSTPPPMPVMQNFNNGRQNFSNNMQNNNMQKDAAFNFSEDQGKDLKAIKAKEYQDELQRQVREKQLIKQREKEEQDRLDKKILMENSSYNPYGRSGGGAPIKDREGKVVADLSHVKADPEKYSPREILPPKNFPPNPYSQQNQSSSNEMLNFMMQQPQQNQLNKQQTGEQQNGTFARGGNGIFGEGKSEDQKRQEEIYKAELQKQIEEKQRKKLEEKEKQKIEDEKEYKRIIEQQQRIKAELEEEERKKKAKEEQGRKFADESKRLADERKKQEKVEPKKLSKFANKKAAPKDDQPNSISPPPPPPQPRSNSPPVPAAAKKMNGEKPPKKSIIKTSKTTADYYLTESRLNLASPSNKEKSVVDPIPERVSSALVTEYTNTGYKSSNTEKSKKNNQENEVITKPIIRKIANRSPSIVSNNEVLTQLKNLKKHLHQEQMQVENELNNVNNRTNVGQLTDMRQNILNVRTPPGDIFYSAINKEPARIRREPSDFQRTYRKDFETPPLKGGFEPKTYFRENTIQLGDENQIDNIFPNDLQKQAYERQLNRINLLNLQAGNNSTPPYEVEQLTARNQQRLRKLRDLEDDNLSMADPNDVLNKFLSRNNRQPSAATLHDDTWLRQPA